MTTTPKISVIVPVYKVEKYLCKCIDSILAQTFTDFELLLIDDGSPDKSGEICEKYAEKDSRIRVFHKENEGVSSARNMGIDNARGEWIYFMDSDDELKNNGLEILLKNTKENVDLVMADYEVYDEKGKQISSSINVKTMIISPQTAISYMFRPADCKYHGYLWTKLFRKSFITDLSLYFNTEIYFNEDRLFIVEYLCQQINKCIYTTYPVYRYYKRPTSAMASLERGFNRKFVSDLKAFALMYKRILPLKDKRNSFLAKEGIYESYLDIKYMMKKYNVQDNSLKNEIDTVLYENVSTFYLSLFFLKRKCARIKMIFKAI